MVNKIFLLGCIAILRIDAAYCYRRSSTVCRSVCLSVCHVREPCKNSRTDGDAVWNVNSGRPNEPCIRRGSSSSLITSQSARNLGFIFDEDSTLFDQIFATSKACCYHITQLRCIRPYLDSTTACIIATSIVHSKLGCCNSLYYNLLKSYITRLQLIQNSLVVLLLKLLNPVISLRSYAFSTGSK